MVAMEETYESTKRANDKRMSQIVKTKHLRAERIIKSKKLRGANNAFVAMARVLKALRTK